MKINIVVELSEEQVFQLIKKGELLIAISSVEPANVCTLKVEEWPDPNDNERAIRLISLAKRYSLSPNELHELSSNRVCFLLDIYTTDKDILRELQECLGFRFDYFHFEDMNFISPLPNGVRFLSFIGHTGVHTMADLKTLTVSELRQIRGIGEKTLRQIEQWLESMNIRIPQE